MNKPSTVCKECIAHHYWHHMDDQKRFFKVMLDDFKNGVVRLNISCINDVEGGGGGGHSISYKKRGSEYQTFETLVEMRPIMLMGFMQSRNHRPDS